MELRNQKIKLTSKESYSELIALLESKGENIYSSSKFWQSGWKVLSFDNGQWLHTRQDPTITDTEFIQKYGKKTLKGLGEKVAIHCTTKEEKMTVGQILVDHLDMPSACIEKALIENFAICYSLWNGRWGWEYPEWTRMNDYTLMPASEFLALNQEPETESSDASIWKHPEIRKALFEWQHQWRDEGRCIDDFLASKRKPQFELTTMDNVIITDKDQLVWAMCDGEIVKCVADFVGDKECWSTKEAAQSHLRSTAQNICLKDMLKLSWEQVQKSIESGGLRENVYLLRESEMNTLLNERMK